MTLPQNDQAYLEERKSAFAITMEGNVTCVVLEGFPLPPGYDRARSDLLLRLSPGYPDIPPDMWWFDPPGRLADGRAAPSTEVMERYLGRTWQRWSRHLSKDHWHSGVDCLESFVALVRKELERCAPKAAA